jgi:CDP-6-deoxy-D-xylo-4-hexulose-3-dehydrase
MSKSVAPTPDRRASRETPPAPTKAGGAYAGLEEEGFFHSLDAPLARQEDGGGLVGSTREGPAEGILLELRGLIEEYLAPRQAPVNVRQLELMRSSYDAEDIMEVVKLILGRQLTMGPEVREFERAWSRWLGAPESVMVNSGSSANLLAVSAFSSPELPAGLRPGDEVIVPAVCWSTTVFPISQCGCVPVVVDVDPETLNIDPGQIEGALSPRTKAIVVVHVLGNPCRMPEIMEIARAHDLLVLEDCCEAHGASIGGRKVGTFGNLSTFSFFFSHHMTTIEGGMISFCDPGRWRDSLISLRAHGWIRGRSDEERWVGECRGFDRRWLFVVLGYNVRATEINAVFGRCQLRRLDRFIANRCATRQYLMARLEPYRALVRTQTELPGHQHSAFGISLLVQPGAPFTRDELQAYLEAHQVQTRPIIAGNMVRHPVMRHMAHRIGAPGGRLLMADIVHRDGLMIGNHHNVTPSQREYVGDLLEDFLSRR